MPLATVGCLLIALCYNPLCPVTIFDLVEGGPGMDIGRAFSYVFEDEDWVVKVLIGAVLVLTGIGFIPVIGYGLEVARRVVRGDPQPLPAWDDWGTKIVEGLVSMVISFVWSLPGIILSSCIAIILVPVSNRGGQVSALAVVASVCVGLLVFLYSLLMALVLPAAMTHYAVTGEFGAAFRFGEVIGLVRNNLGAYLMVLVVTILGGFIGSLGTIACAIGVVFTSFYSVLVTYHAYGQAYRVAVGNVNSELPSVS
jgi:hypothetical protein